MRSCARSAPSERRSDRRSGPVVRHQCAVSMQRAPPRRGRAGSPPHDASFQGCAMLKLRTVAGIYAVWLVAIEVVFYVTHGKNENVLQLAVMAGCVPAAIQLLLT